MRSRRAFDSDAVVRDAPKPWRPRAPDPVASRIWKRLAFSAVVVLALLISSALRAEPVPTHTNEPAQPAVIQSQRMGLHASWVVAGSTLSLASPRRAASA